MAGSDRLVRRAIEAIDPCGPTGNRLEMRVVCAGFAVPSPVSASSRWKPYAARPRRAAAPVVRGAVPVGISITRLRHKVTGAVEMLTLIGARQHVLERGARMPGGRFPYRPLRAGCPTAGSAA